MVFPSFAGWVQNDGCCPDGSWKKGRSKRAKMDEVVGKVEDFEATIAKKVKGTFYFIFLIIYIYFAPRPNENIIILTYFLGGGG